MRLTSVHNPVVRYVRSLERSRVRRDEGVYLVEGIRLVTEAIGTHQRATIALYDPDLLERSPEGSHLLQKAPEWAQRSVEVDERVLAAAAQTETPAGIVAVLTLPEWPPLASHRHDHFGVILDRLADPGNAGTILRTGEAAGVGYVVAVPGTVDLFAPKVVRAGMGAHFRLPVYQGMSWQQLARDMPDVHLVAAETAAQSTIYDFEWPDHGALVVGSEAHGISESPSKIHGSVRIPMKLGVESLNASVAASIIMYSVLGPAITGDK